MAFRVMSVCCSLLLLVPVSSFSANDQRIIPVGDDVYSAIEALWAECGSAFPSDALPYSVDELKWYLETVDFGLLSNAGQRAYRYVESHLAVYRLADEASDFGIRVSANASLESYMHANPERTDWIHGYEQRLPILDVPFEAWIYDGLYVNTTLTLKEEYRAISEDSANYTNIPPALTYLDWYFPFRAFISVGGKHWNLQFGRDTLSWGNGRSGNLMLSDYADFHDFVRLTTYWDWLKFSSVYVVLEPWLKPAEHDSPTGWYDDFGELYKAFFGHRLEFRVFDRIEVAISESVIFGNKYPELKDFNPLMIFHNWYIPERANSLLSLELQVNPYRWINIYGQYAIDEFQTAYEVEEGSGGRPGAAGYLVGIEGAFPVGPGYIGVCGEYVHCDPWLYNRWHPLTRYTSRRRIWSYVPPDRYEWVDKPLGYWAGPDAIVQSYRLSYTVYGAFAGWVDLRLVSKGEVDLETPYELGPAATGLVAPVGDSQDTLVVRIHVEGKPLPFLRIGSDLYRVRVVNYQHVAGAEQEDWEWVCFVSLEL